MIYRHIAFLYALKTNLRGGSNDCNVRYLNDADKLAIEGHRNLHNAILNLQSADLQRLSINGQIDGFRFIEINSMLVRFSDSMGMSERIKNTVFPTTASIPLNQITRSIEINLLQMMGATDVPEPVKPINDEYVL